MKKEILIEGMSCGHCVKHVENALKEIEGIEDVSVNLEAKKATIESNSNIEDDKIKEVIDDAGYDVIEIKSI